jgi:S-DNA-T family DNA segregation ATPase FtsK/SpoIIIE
MSPQIQRRLREFAFILASLVAAYLLVCFTSFDTRDPGWSSRGAQDGVLNLGGPLGAWLADLGLTVFGYTVYLFPLMLAFLGWRLLRTQAPEPSQYLADTAIRLGGFVIALGSGAALLHLHWLPPSSGSWLPGGILGELIGGSMFGVSGHTGASLLLLALFLGGITLFTGLSWLALMDAVGKLALMTWAILARAIGRWREGLAGRQARAKREQKRVIEQKKTAGRAAPRIELPAPAPEPEPETKKPVKPVQKALFEDLEPTDPFPPLSLLDDPPERKKGYSREALEAMSRQVEIKLADFGIEVEVVAVHPGPVITRFELQPAAGVKSSRISNLSKDLARGLSVVSVRVVEVIPGKTVIGLELPNSHREIVYLSETFHSDNYQKAKSPLTLALGKDIAGNPVVADIAKMPHLLVAGTTGSGKSVAINAMILSLLYKAPPEEVRLILVDPKMLELSVYEGIPHLLAPVVTDMKEASNALRWCVAEMERRYKLMSKLGVRNLAGFNRKVRDAEKAGEPIKDPLWQKQDNALEEEAPELEPLPFIVVVVDELADMMMMVGKKVEELIARLAQKARASGIHLILATQRPSVDVITGLIKANIPTRIAFQVSSKIDSRTILDQSGAEDLLGHGDMLYQYPGLQIPERVHGAFVDDHEVHGVVDHLKRHYGEPNYKDEILEDTQMMDEGMAVGANGLPEATEDADDALYDQAVYFVCKTRKVSISSVQRKLKIGYNRAANIVDTMEAQGVVSPAGHNGAREVLAPPPVED